MIFLVAFLAAAMAAIDEEIAPWRARRARMKAERAKRAHQGRLVAIGVRRVS